MYKYLILLLLAGCATSSTCPPGTLDVAETPYCAQRPPKIIENPMDYMAVKQYCFALTGSAVSGCSWLGYDGVWRIYYPEGNACTRDHELRHAQCRTAEHGPSCR